MGLITIGHEARWHADENTTRVPAARRQGQRKGRPRNLFHLEQKVACRDTAEVEDISWSMRIKIAKRPAHGCSHSACVAD
jgi:hypothetical protein